MSDHTTPLSGLSRSRVNASSATAPIITVAYSSMALVHDGRCYPYKSGFLELNTRFERAEPPIAAISHRSRPRDLARDLISRTLGASVPQADSNAAVGPRRAST